MFNFCNFCNEKKKHREKVIAFLHFGWLCIFRWHFVVFFVLLNFVSCVLVNLFCCAVIIVIYMFFVSQINVHLTCLSVFFDVIKFSVWKINCHKSPSIYWILWWWPSSAATYQNFRCVQLCAGFVFHLSAFESPKAFEFFACMFNLIIFTT